MNFDQLSQNFVSSLSKEYADLKTDKFAVHDYRDQKQGRGLIALKDIQEGEDLFSIPRTLILNIQTCSLSDEQKQKLNKLGQWEALIIIILYEKSLGDKSKWFDYFQILPFDDQFNNLMFWEDSQLENLKPSFVLERIGKENAIEMYIKLFPGTITELGIYNELNNVTIDQFHRVASVIMSYSFDVENPEIGEENDDDDDIELVEDDDDDDNEENGDTIDVSKEGYYKSLVPLADTLNADTNLCNANLTYTPEMLVMKSTCFIPRGEQIYNTYANHPNSEILRRYGYVEFDGSKHDFGELKLDSILKFFVEKYEFPQKVIDKIVTIITESEYLLQLTEGQNIIIDTYDCYVDGEVYPELILLLQILTVLGVLNKQDKKLLKRSTKTELEKFLNRNFKKNYQLVEQKKLMRSTYDNFIQIIENRIQEYSNVDEGADIVKDYNNRESMAKCVLVSELKSLQNSREKLLSSFELIEDDKMIKNVMKRKLEEDAEKAERKKRR